MTAKTKKKVAKKATKPKKVVKKKAPAKKGKVAKKAAPKKTAAKRARKGSAGRHPTKVQFDDDTVRFIRLRAYLRSRGERKVGVSNDISQAVLAEKYGCSTRAIYAVATGASYAEVPNTAPSKEGQ